MLGPKKYKYISDRHCIFSQYYFADPQSVKVKVDTGTDDMFTINGVGAKSALEPAAAAALDNDGLHFLRLPGNQAPPYDGETINLNGYILGSYVSE